MDIVKELCVRGYSESEANNLIANFARIEKKTRTGRTINQIMSDLIIVMDEYHRRHGEYVKLEFPLPKSH